MTAAARLHSLLQTLFTATRAYQAAWIAAGCRVTPSVALLGARRSRVRVWAVDAGATLEQLHTVARNAVRACPAVAGEAVPARALPAALAA
jgi:hypothetical protein